jgi:hypothetical protein
MAFTSIETLNGVTTIKVTAFSDVSGINLKRSGDGYIVEYSGSLVGRVNDTLLGSVTKVKVILSLGGDTIQSLQKEISLGLNIGEVRVDPTNALKTEWGSLMKDQFHYAWINGTPGSDTFDFTDTTSPSTISSATRALMATDKRGIWVDLGSGADTAVGSPYGDNFNISGSGVKKIDGGENDGTTPWGDKAKDTVDVYIKLDSADYTNQTVIDTLVSTITVSALASSDPEAANGYTHVLKRGTTVLAYLKNVEQINVQIWKDFNEDSRVQWDADPTKNESQWVKNFQLAVNVGEIRLKPNDDTKTDWGINLSDAYHFAWINGTLGADTITADSLVSVRTKNLMEANKRGLWIDAGAGDDTITGSPYADNILGGDGKDKVDGGTNIAPTGQKGQDVFEIRLTATDTTTAQALLAKIKVLPSDDPNFTWMVQRVNDAGVVVETDYLINIEAVSINVNNANNQWLAGRWQAIALDVGEIRLKADSSVYPNQQTDWGTKLTDQMHFAWVNGTSATESFDYTGATSGAATVSAATKALMVRYERGLWVNMGGGNDTIVGSPYGDNFNIYAAKFNINGLGTRYIDGGQNSGKTPWGGNATDNIDLFVENLTQASQIRVVSVSESPATGSEEAVAKAAGYSNKIMSGTTVVAYVKNIEFVNIQVWNDRNGDGQLNWDQDSTKNEMTWVSNVRLAVEVNEIRVKLNSDGTPTNQTDWGTPLADAYHMAWINGTDGADPIVVKSLVSPATQALQLLYSRGLYVDGGAGNDTIVGSDYSDNIVGGKGDDLVDGGTQTAPTGQRGQDVFEVRLVAANATEANAMLSRVKVLPASDKEGYQWKVELRDANNNVIETDYLTDIEAVNINVSTPGNKWLAGRWQTIALNVNEIRVKNDNSVYPNQQTDWGSKLSDQMHFAWINGTPSNESFDYTGNTLPGAETISTATKTLMDNYKRGLLVDLGGGTDDIVGSPYGDNYSIAGSGVRFIDGGANDGKTPWGNRASDNLDVFVNSKAAADTITVVAVAASPQAGTPEAAAKFRGFTSKVMKGNEILAFVKNIEFINIQIWNDINGDGQRQWDADATKNEMTWVSNIRLAVDVNEMRLKSDSPAFPNQITEWGTKVSDQYHFAWLNATDGNDTITAKTILSSELTTLQDNYKRGVWIDAGAGNDKITGTDFSDNINGGAGNDEVDGGTQTAPTGQRGQDVFEVRLVAANVTEANTLISRVSVLPSDKTEFQWMVVQKNASGQVTETDYLKNIEAVSINVNNANNQWLAGRWQNTALNVGEIRLDPNDSTRIDNGNKLADQMHFAWVNGTAADEKFDYTGTIVGADTISDTTKSLMVSNKRGLWVDMMGGSDTAVGSPYGDNFNIVASFSGIDYIDGGANSGITPWGSPSQDTIDLYVSTDSEASSVQVVSLTQTSDPAAYADNYTQKIMMGTKTLAYIKNIEKLNIQKWVDINGDGQRQGNSDPTKSELSYIRGSDLMPVIGYPNNGDATKNTIWVNGTSGSDIINVGTLLATLPTSTDPKLNWAGSKLEINVNADQGGNDTIIGSNNPDMITVRIADGTVTYVDGGASIGKQTWMGYTSLNAYDQVSVIVSSELGARALELFDVTSSSDPDAFSKEYKYKLTSYGSQNNPGSIVYIKNVEQVGVRIWTDLNNNGKNDWGNEITNFSFPILQNAQVSWVSGTKGSPGTPPSNFYISGSAFTPVINASTLIDDFIATRKLYPVSSTDLPANFELSSIANSSASFGAWIMAGNGNHTLSGTNFTDYFVIDPKGNNLIDGGSDIGYWMYNGAANLAQDRVRVTESMDLEGLVLQQSFITLATGNAPAFSIGLSPAVTGDDVTGTYQIKSSDKVFIALLPKATKLSFAVTKAEMAALITAMEVAATPADLQTAITNASAVADLKYYVYAGYTDINNDGNRDYFSVATLNAPVYTSTEAQFGAAALADRSLNTLVDGSRFNATKHHLINISDNTDWINGGSASTADTTAIDAFVTSSQSTKTNYQFALVTYDDFQRVTGVQLIKNTEAIEFRHWFDANQDGRQQGQEVSSTFLSYSLLADSAIYNTADLSTSTIAGKQYAGGYSGTSKVDTINVKTSMQSGIGAAEVAKKLGVVVANFGGDDAVTGTDYDDLFWLGDGVDTINGGTGTDRIAFKWKPASNATLGATKNGNVITISQTVVASPSNIVTNLVQITLTDTGGTILQLNDTLTSSFGTNPTFALNTADSFTNVEELVILLDSSLKNADGNYVYNTGGITDLNAFTLKLKPTVDYPLGADATKTTINFSGTPYADVIDAAAMIQTLPTSATPRDDWKNSSVSTYITLNGGGDTLTGTNNSDQIDPGSGINYIDGGTNVGRTNWTPGWISSDRAYWGAEGAYDAVRFYIKSTSELSKLRIDKLSSLSTLTDLAAFNDGYTTKAIFTNSDNSVSTNYLKNIEYVGLRLWTDANNNGVRESSEVTAFSYFAIDKPIVNWRFVDLNDTDHAPCYFDFNVGKFVSEVNAQQAIDDFITNRKNFPVLKADKTTFDAPSDYNLSDYVNYNHAYGAYIQIGNGDHKVTGTDFIDYFLVGAVGNNWIDGGNDVGYVKYEDTNTSGIISSARDIYRLLNPVSSTSNLNANISKSNYKVIRLSDNYDLLNSIDATPTINSAITAATTAVKEKYNIASGTNAEFAVVKLNPSNTSEILGIDFLRNIESFQMRNWLDSDGNTRSTGSEVGSKAFNSLVLKSDSTLYQTADQTFYTFNGMNYAGSATGTSGVDEINLQTILEGMLTTYPALSSNSRGLIFADQGGDDTITGTSNNDFFWLSSGNDSINGAAGSQDRVGIYLEPSATVATSISVDRLTTGVIKVNLTQTGSTATEIARFTLTTTSNDRYWTATEANATYAYSFSGAGTNFGTDVLRNIEKVVFVLPSTALDANGNPLNTQLTGLVNNMLVIDLPTS